MSEKNYVYGGSITMPAYIAGNKDTREEMLKMWWVKIFESFIDHVVNEDIVIKFTMKQWPDQLIGVEHFELRATAMDVIDEEKEK